MRPILQPVLYAAKEREKSESKNIINVNIDYNTNINIKEIKRREDTMWRRSNLQPIMEVVVPPDADDQLEDNAFNASSSSSSSSSNGSSGANASASYVIDGGGGGVGPAKTYGLRNGFHEQDTDEDIDYVIEDYNRPNGDFGHAKDDFDYIIKDYARANEDIGHANNEMDLVKKDYTRASKDYDNANADINKDFIHADTGYDHANSGEDHAIDNKFDYAKYAEINGHVKNYSSYLLRHQEEIFSSAAFQSSVASACIRRNEENAKRREMAEEGEKEEAEKGEGKNYCEVSMRIACFFFDACKNRNFLTLYFSTF